MLTYAYTIIYVNNIKETVAFYKKAFGFSEKFITPEADYAELETGTTTISFATTELAKQNFPTGVEEIDQQKPPQPIQLSFTTPTIQQDFEKAIEAGAKPLTELVQKPWGQTVGYLLDLNGILIEICTPISK